MIVDPKVGIDEQVVARLFDEADRMPVGLGTNSIGDLRDYSDDQLAAIDRGILKLRRHAFYELKTNAISAMLHGDSRVALVLACAALEGVHGAFVRLALRDKVPGEPSAFNRFVSDLLREQGFYSLVQLSSRVLLTEAERPSEDDLALCLKGVTIRNAIMHAGIKASGVYKLREFSPSEMNDGYKGLMSVYGAFECAVESRERP